jgi:hypothetical protein
MVKGCLSGCLEGFIVSIIIITLVVIFTGGTVNLELLFFYALIAIILNILISMVISVIKRFF